MKTIFIALITFLLVSQVTAQGLFSVLSDKYSGTEGFSATNLTRDMFDLYLKKKQIEPVSPAYETLKKLDNILVVSYSSLSAGKETDKPAGLTSEMQKIILNHYNVQKFTLFKTENRYGEDLKVFIRKNGEKVAALSLVSVTPTRMTLVELNGDVDLAGISDISNTLNLRGLENLYKIKGQQDVFVYGQKLPEVYFPNSTGWNFDMQKDLEQSLDLLEKEKGEYMKDFALKNKEMTEKQKEMLDKQMEKQKEMAEKYRQMADKYGRHPIFLSAPGDTNMSYYIDGKKVTIQEINKLNPDQIESVSVIKPDKEKPSKKGELKIITRKKKD